MNTREHTVQDAQSRRYTVRMREEGGGVPSWSTPCGKKVAKTSVSTGTGTRVGSVGLRWSRVR